MRQSQLFSKTRKQIPADEESINAQLLLRAGFIHKEMAGAYSFLPLGLRVLNNINAIIREEMDALGAQEIFLTSLQDPEPWKKSGRWEDSVIDVWFKTKLAGGGDVGLGNTHEEPLTRLMTHHIASYKDLPVYAYQIQTKFRNELRAKSGIMRTREFLMKDLYSFSKTREEHNEFYEKAKTSYVRIFKRLGLGDKTFLTMASGGSFSKYSHEFQTLCEAGEDTIYLSKDRGIAVNKEVFNDEVLGDLGKREEDFEETRAVEVGNIFSLGTKYSEVLGLKYKNENGEELPVFMGSYGIGPSRVMGTIVELCHDEKGIIWPESVAPFFVHLIPLSGAEEVADRLHEQFAANGIEVLYDDREASAGEKFADADLLGIPYRIVMSEKSLDKNSVEVKRRSETDSSLIPLEEILDYIKNRYNEVSKTN